VPAGGLSGGCEPRAEGLQAFCKRACKNDAVNRELVHGALELRVLGGIELMRGGASVPIGGPKPRLVLAVLVAYRGSVVSTERLCQELWGDDAPEDPPAVLQSHLSRLRRLLRPEAEIVARPPGYVLDVDGEAVDAGRFEQLCARAHATEDPKVAVDRLQAALDCWRGAAFDEFADLDWARGESVRLDELRANAHEDLLQARLDLGEHSALVGELEALVAEHPLRERLWRQLIVALYRSGRSAEALRRASALRRLLRDELGLEPSPEVRELEARVLSDDPTLMHTKAPARRAAPRRLPVETTQLVGRSDDLERIVGSVQRDRLLTLTGPGGVGKTRLAREVASELWDQLGGEVFVAELAPVRDPLSTVAAIATAVDVQQRQHLSVEETLVEYLRARQALLVLDNCEHLRATVAPLAHRLLSLCPEVTIVATSREVLGLPGEHVFRVGPLETAPEGSSADAVFDAAAVRLFVERARAARAGFALEPDDVDVIAEIVRRLDGLPLAIELAAARVRAMSLRALAERLDQRFELLAGAQTSMIARHRTLHDLVAWSHELLDPDEQRLFARLCVFAGTFPLEAAEEVCADDELGGASVPRLLANLVDKSMVQLVDNCRPRYRVLETLREYGRETLADAERGAVAERHARWYLEVAERCASSLTGPDEADAVQTLDADFDNLRAAYLWALEHGDVDVALRIVTSLREYAFRRMRAEVTGWAESARRMPGAVDHQRYPIVVAIAGYGTFVRGHLEEAIELGQLAMEAAAEIGVDTSGLAERTLGNALFYRGDKLRAPAWIDRMIASAREGSPARLAHALYMRSIAYTSVGDVVKGAQLAGEARAVAATSGSPTAHAQSAYALGVALESTDPTEALVHIQRAVEIASDAGNRWIQAFALSEMLWLEARQGRPREALAQFADVVDLWYRGGDWANQWLSLRHVFGILVQLRAHLAAATLHGALTAAGAAYALPFEAVGAERIAALVDDLREQLGTGAFAAAVRHGASMSDGEIIRFVRDQIGALTST
jgi:predicted ATPase/DNA-binding SARP family transcriptional activator